MDVDSLVRQACEPLAEAILEDSKVAGFVPPGLHMQKISGAITGIGIALSDSAFMTRDWIARTKFPKALGDADKALASLRGNYEKNLLNISKMNAKLNQKIAAFSSSGEKFRESERRFFVLQFDGMSKSLSFLNQVAKETTDPALETVIRQLLSLVADTLKIMDAFVLESTGKNLQQKR